MNLVKNVSILNYLAHQNPRLWELVHPHVPFVLESLRNVLAATVVKTVAAKIPDPHLANELNSVGKVLFETGKKAMSYENMQWLPGDEVMLNPQPEPPGRPPFYGALLAQLADTITSSELKGAAASIRKIGSSLVQSEEKV